MKRTIITIRDQTLQRHQNELKKVPMPWRELRLDDMLRMIHGITVLLPNGEETYSFGNARVKDYRLLQDPARVQLEFTTGYDYGR